MADNETKLPAPLTSLSARLLVLTIFFVMVAEFLIWAPSVSRFRKAYLEEHVVRAHLSTLAFEAIPKEALIVNLGKPCSIMPRPTASF